MKKLASIVAGVAILCAPLTAGAVEKMNKKAMQNTTGQAGVSIAIDNVKIESYTGTTKYTDVVDAGGSVGGGSVFIAGELTAAGYADKHTVKEFQAITDGTSSFDRAAYKLAGDEDFMASALTIDVGKCAVLSEGLSKNTKTDVTVGGVIIGLPTLEIQTSAEKTNVGVMLTSAANTGASFIQIEKGASTMAILGRTLEIAPH